VPFVVLVFAAAHMIVLHATGRTSPLLLHENLSRVTFFPGFIIKDLWGVWVIGLLLSMASFSPWSFGDPEN